MKIPRLIICLILPIVLSAPVRAQNWTIIDTSITHTTAALRSAFFTNSTTGYVVGGNDSGVILKTSDAGNSWQLTAVNKYLECVYFPSDSVGYAVGSAHTIMKTTDAGTTWVYQFVPSLSTLYTAMSVCFINNDTGFVGLKNGPGYAFLKTYNGGTTWINDVSDTVHSTALFKINDSTICGISGALSKTTNKGANWISYAIPTGSWATSLWFLNVYVGFATLDHGNGTPCFNYSSLIKTTDGGQTWAETNYDCDFIYSLNFPSDSIGFMLGSFTPGGPRKLWKTVNGGDTWLLSNYPVGEYNSTSLYGLNMLCTDTNTCFIITNMGIIIKTTNGGGTNWTVSVKEEKKAAQNFLIYPNPSGDYINISVNLLKQSAISITIVDILGQQVLSESTKNVVGYFTKQLPVNSLSSGMYIVNVGIDGKMSSKKIIKQ